MSMTEIIMERDALKQQLANATKQIVMLREFVKLLRDYIPASAVGNMTVQEALAATADLSGLVLCDAEPVAWMFDGLTGMYFGKEDKLPRPEAIQLFRRKKP